MSATISPVAGAVPTLDISGTRPVPFGRLVSVELRKMMDTRAGRWLVIATGAVTALVMLIQIWVGLAQDLALGFQDFMIGMNMPMGIFLPVLGIMSVTSEWGQRTALVTFTQVASRSRVIAAKYAATLAIALVAIVVGVGLAVLATLVFSSLDGTDAAWNLGADDVAKYFGLHILGMSTGFAFGMLLLNTAAAIVAYFVFTFVLPPLFMLGAALMKWFADLQPWIDFSAAQTVLTTGGDVTGEQWGHLAVSGLLWLALPFVVGLWRVLRAEVK